MSLLSSLIDPLSSLFSGWFFGSSLLKSINFSILNHLNFASLLSLTAPFLLDITSSSPIWSRLWLVIFKSLLLNLASLILICLRCFTFWLSLDLLWIRFCCCLITRPYFFRLSLSALIIWLLIIGEMGWLNLHSIFIRISLIWFSGLLVNLILHTSISVLILSFRIGGNIRINLSIFSLGIIINFILIIYRLLNFLTWTTWIIDWRFSVRIIYLIIRGNRSMWVISSTMMICCSTIRFFLLSWNRDGHIYRFRNLYRYFFDNINCVWCNISIIRISSSVLVERIGIVFIWWRCVRITVLTHRHLRPCHHWITVALSIVCHWWWC